MKILITGASGFVGQHLLSMFIDEPVDLLVPTHGELDILDNENVSSYMNQFQPDSIIHLAAQSNVGLSWYKPRETLAVNTLGTLNLYTAYVKQKPNGMFLFVGSSDVYGSTARENKPLTESMLCDPQNPYAISKLAAEKLLIQLSKRDKTNVICTRSFNQYGPGQNRGFVVSDFASQLAAIKLGYKASVLNVGNLNAKREFLYIDDVVKVYKNLIMHRVESGIYNIAVGNAISVRDILEKLIDLAGVSVDVQKDPERYRPVDVPVIQGDATKIRKVCNVVETDIETGLKNTFDYWLKRCYREHESSHRS